ncbi:MAG: AAA family ATPase [Faecalibacterium sp.]|nr:AAA family ATPase [Faecalibacterium sp.]
MNDKRFLQSVFLRETPPPGEYYARLPAVQFLAQGNRLNFAANVTFFVGENGTGKSTLLEAIAVAAGFNAEGGSRNFRFSTAATHSGLHRQLTLARGAYPRDGFFLRAESFYNTASYVDEIAAGDPTMLNSYGGVSLHDQSHGESFMALMNHRFGGQGLYLLDEPEAALSPTRQMALLALIHQLASEGSQFIIATHSPILITCPGSCIYQFTEQAITPVQYQDTEHFQLTKRFLNDPQRMLQLLLQQDT